MEEPAAASDGEPSDAELVSRAKRGERRALDLLVLRHQRAMLSIAGAYFAAQADAEDAVQDALVKACRSIGQLQVNERFANWLTRITVNTCLDILRARTDKVSLEEFSSTFDFRPRVGQVYLTPATLASRSEQAELLRAAIGRLSEAQRVAVMLRYGQGMAYEVIAAYLDVPASAVRGRLYKAKRALRRLLGPPGGSAE